MGIDISKTTRNLWIPYRDKEGKKPERGDIVEYDSKKYKLLHLQGLRSNKLKREMYWTVIEQSDNNNMNQLWF